MTILAEIFGSTGLATSFFGGQWYFVGMFLIFIISVYLYSRNFSQEAMALFIFAAFLLTTLNGLFLIPANWIVIIIFFITILIGISLKTFLTR